MKVKILSGGRITIPALIRQRLGLKPGTKLLFDDSVGYVKAIEVTPENMRSRSIKSKRGSGSR